METKWLEDFVSLAETRSFSRSAQLRHVTQPAFSRRIQSLETWAGTDLVDRSSYPTRLTPAGEALYDQSMEILQSLQSARAMVRAHSAAGHDFIEFAVPHTLAFTFFPSWASSLATTFGRFKSHLIGLNVHDAVMRLVEGHCDLLIAYHHASQPPPLDSARFEMVILGQEQVLPVTRPNEAGGPLFCLPGHHDAPLPYLGYAPGAYLGQVVETLLRQVDTAMHLDRVYETDMAEGLKAMALEGHGLAFLPYSAIVGELRAGRLVSAMPRAMEALQATLEIRMYRARPGAHPPKSAAQALWNFLTLNQNQNTNQNTTHSTNQPSAQNPNQAKT